MTITERLALLPDALLMLSGLIAIITGGVIRDIIRRHRSRSLHR